MSHSAEKFGRGTTLPFCAVFQRNSGSEKVLKKRGKEYQKFLSKVFCLSVPKNLVGEQPFSAVFQKMSGSENVLKKRGKEYQKFQSIVFCLTVPKIWLGEQPLCAVFQNISGSGKCLKEKRGVSKASLESFLSHSAEKFRRGTTLMCCVSENFWQRKCFEK